VQLPLPKPGSVAAWKFQTVDYDISFGVTFTETSEEESKEAESKLKDTPQQVRVTQKRLTQTSGCTCSFERVVGVVAV
jgi:hypothetical protein